MRYPVSLLLAAWVVLACGPSTAAPAAPKPPAASAQNPAGPGANPPGAATGNPDVADPQLVEAARREGSVVWYTSVDLSVAQSLAKAFTEKYGVQAEVNRNGSERIFAQFMKEADTGVNAADVVHTSDASNFIEMKEKGYLAPYRPAAADRFIAAYRDRMIDPDNQWFGMRITLYDVGYNTNMLKPEEVPTSWKELGDPRYRGKLVVAHPSYSGTAVTYIQALLGLYGWDYFKAIAATDPLIVQSTIDVTSKVVGGERAIGAGSNDYSNYAQFKRGQPIKIVQPSEGVPFILSPQAIARSAPHPNAARLFDEYSLSMEAQALLVNEGGLYSVREDVPLPDDRTPLSDLKILFPDPRETVKNRPDIVRQFTEIFGV
jgi:iron(III) transport system substrate-binding protein